MSLAEWIMAKRAAATNVLGVYCLGMLFLVASSLSYGQETAESQKSVAALQTPAEQAVLNNARGPGQPVHSLPLREMLLRRGDLTLRDATIAGALFSISKAWGVNIVVGEDVKGTVSGDFKQTPLREVLDSILLANRYSYRTIGNSLVVQRTKEVGTANPLLQSITIPIQHGDVKEIVEGVKLLVSEQGNVVAMESARSLLVIDYADRIKSISNFVARMDGAASQALGGMPVENFKRLDVAYFHTQFIPAVNAKEPLEAVLSNVGRVAVMPDENRLVVVDYPVNIELARKLLERIDHPRPQVRITALIYDISLKDVEKLGLNWNQVGKGNDLGEDGTAQQSITLDTTTMAPFEAGSAGGTLTVKSLTRNFDIKTIGHFLQTADDARLLADPNVTVTDNELAEWKSVSEIPYQQLSQSSFGGQIGTTAFKEAGITLRVKPMISADGTIEMFIEPEFSRLTGFTPNNRQPIIDTRKASTTVRIANRQTLVLGGLRQRTDTGQFNGIPLLKDMRLIGPVFRARDTDVRESELIVFIRPEIINYDNPPTPRQAMAQETVACKLGRVPQAEGCAGPGRTCDGPLDSCSNAADLMPLPAVEGNDTIIEESNSAADGQPPKDAAGVKGRLESMIMDQKTLRPAYQSRFRATSDTDLRQQPGFEPKVPSPREPADIKTGGKKTSLWQRMFGA